MPSIYLRNKSGQYEAGGGVTASVSCENNTPCKLFQRYTHTLTPPQNGKIHVHKAIAGWALGVSKCLTLTTDGRYSSAKLKQVDVYFNKHDTSNTPLLFVLHFQKNGDGNGVENRYYRMSSYDKDATGCATKKIEGLCQYKNESDILCPLVQESDVLSDVLMYDIMQRPNGNGDGTPCTYNCNKINVTEEKNGQPTLTGTGFTRFKHTPNNGQTNGKKACVTYRCNTLLDSGSQELDDVQGKPYSCITVYFGEKAKRPCTHKGATPGVCVCPPGAKAATCTPGEGNTCPPATASPEQTCSAAPGDGTTDHQDVPLLLELHKQPSSGSNNNTEYYVHRRKAKNGETGNNDQYYWVKLTLPTNGQENGLKQLLEAINMPVQPEGSGNGTGLTELLSKPANGAGQTYNLTLLLKRLEFDLTDSVVILLDKNKTNCAGGYGDTEIGQAISTLQTGGKNGNINPLKLNNGTKIQVTDAKNGLSECLKKYGYCVVAHDFGKATQSKLGPGCSAGLRFLVPTKENGNGVDGGGSGQKYAQLKLYQGDTTTPANLEYLYYQNGGSNGESKVYVVFYAGTGTGGDRAGTDHDPRPLLLCYQGQTYRPKDKTGYDEQTWVKVDGLNKCLCQNGSDTANGPDDKLLGAVTGVVGFLNTVNLYQHPGPGTSKGAGDQACPNSGVGGAATCQPTSTGSTTNSCTYPVHRYNNKPIQVKVTCSPVNAKSGSTCYKKLTHTPIGTGTNGATSAPNANTGFRLGDVEYCPNGDSGPKGSIKYYPNGSNGDSNLASVTNRWAPLVAVWAYFYDQDTQYKDPLLVVLMFRVSRTEAKECYKLKTANGSKLEWEKDTDACKKDGPELARHLDEIRYCLKYVLKVELRHNQATQYALVGRDAKPGSAGTFDKQINGGQVTVCEVVPCHKLNDSGYKCFRHDLKTALRGHHHEVAGLAFTLPGKNGSGSGSVIEIPLDPNGGKGDQVKCANGPGLANGQSGSKITYNQCMGDVCVYFYAHKGMGEGDNQTDTVPLMVKFNGHFYKPCDRDNYFTRWVCVSELASVSCKPGCKCCCCPTNADCGSDCTAQCSTDACKDDCECCSQLVKALNEVNLALNRIDLDKSNLVKTGSGSNGKGYGLPEKCDKTRGIMGCKLTDKVGNNRICLTKQDPNGTDAKSAYTRVVHRTKNGFQIGDIKYNNQDIVDSGVKINGGQNGGDTTIPIAGGTGHKTLVKSCQWNTVAAYYSKTDSKHQLPQLIVILKTDSEVQSGNGNTVTGSTKPSTAYGYYILATQSGVSNGYEYQYKWRLVNSQSGGSGVQLDDATDFRLLNAGVILLERRDASTGGATYGDEQLKTAIASADMKSPGNSKDVNRLQDKNIKVTDETDDESASAHKCIKDYWFSAVGHNLSQLVDLPPQLQGKINGVKLITGLRFLIPTSDEGKYSQVKLCANGAGNSCSEERHYYQSGKKIRVFFYGNDPRPLLLCCNGVTYKPKDKNEYFQRWYKDETVENCVCNGDRGKQNEPLLKALITTVGFLNKVELQQHPGKAGGETCLNNGASGQGTATQCQAASSDGSGTCTYEVHKFQGKSIQVKVECSQVKGKTGSSCYKKLTHTPIGTSGSGEGFRLGDVEYCKNCGSTGPKGSIKYYPNGSNGDSNLASVTNRWAPLVAVWAYFYDQDTQYKDPLLVVLMFRVSRTEAKECYKLKTANGSKLEWEKDTDACKKDGPELAAHLDEIRYCLKYVLKVELRHNQATQYALVGRDAKPGSAGTFDKQINGGQVTVCEVVPCHKLNDSGYKCFRHDLKTALRGHHHEVAGLAFTLPGKNGSGSGSVIEIPLDPNGGKGDQVKCANGPGLANGQSGSKITYNQCMGDVCVYFYAHKGMGEGDNQTDTVPLMVKFNGHFYKPCDRDNYFTRWVCVSELASVSCKPGCKCCCCPTNADCGSDCTAQCSTDACKDDCECCSQLVKALNEVNLALNRIDLDKSNLVKTGSGSNGKGYGLPEKCDKTRGIMGCKLTDKVGNNRICLTKQDPNGTDAKSAYTRVVHRTKNGFQIGDIKYNNQDIVDSGVKINGGQNGGDTTIPIAGGTGHKTLVKSCQWNTVAAYYSKTDSKHQLPQLIVILKTDSEVQSGNGNTVTGSTKPSTAYGYYILATQSGVSNGYEYQYKWRLVNSQSGGSGVQLDDATDFRLLNAGVILLERRDASTGGATYGDEQLKTAIASADMKSPGNSKDVNRLQDKNIKVTDETDDESASAHKCIKDYWFSAVGHNLSQLVDLPPQLQGKINGVKLITGLRFLIPTSDEGKYSQVKLCANGAGNSCSEERHYYQSGKKIRVFFYGNDPRPLLLCCNGVTYKPKDKNEYFQRWYKDETVENCVCNGDRGKQNEPLLKALITTVGFLNKVELQQHPGKAGGETCLNNGASGQGTATQCQAASSDGSGTCTYEVHKFQGKSIQVKVECSQVKGKTGSSCYKKLTHTPIGTSGSGEGFRLGDVEYCKNCGSTGPKGSIKYYPNGSNGDSNLASVTNRWAPLVAVWAYFYDQDTQYKDPLLVVLMFRVSRTEAKECYKLKTANGSKLEWEKDTDACKKDGPELAAHLDEIRYCLKYVLKVELRHNQATQYALVGRDAKPGSAAGFTQINSGQVTVCEVVPCHKLNDSGYKCFRHDLKTALRGHHHEVAGLAFTLPGKNGSGSGSVIEIPLDPNGGKGDQVKCANGPGLANGQSGSKITYNQCMGDVCVYFYAHKGMGEGDNQTDTVPLMVKFNGHFYKPCDRDNYFTRWVCVSELASVSCKPGCKCCCCPTNADCGSDCTAQCSTDACKDDCECCSQLVKALNEVNLALNRIDLDKSNLVKTGSGSNGKGYGLPEKCDKTRGIMGCKLTDKVGNNRICLTKQDPNGTDAKSAYTRVVHRTKNGFQIGDIKYNNQDIVDSGVKINGGQNGGDTTIPIAGGTGHKTLVKSCQWNTVAAYYSKTDSKHQLPQLIVILKTDSEVQSGNGNTVTGSTKPSTAYGYYVLATKNGVSSGVVGGSGYEYQWRLVNGTEKPTTGVQLDDETDFKLLNAGVILLERRDASTGGATYGDEQLKTAIASADMKSPGNSKDVNRLQDKNIKVTDETDDESASAHKCIKDYWFSAVGHNLSQLVDLPPQLQGKINGVKLITGLRFLIPTSDEGKYSQVKLCANGAGNSCSEERHYYQSGKKIRVFFYGNDPRPLLLCCNGVTYKPKDKNEYFQRWYKDETVENCVCNGDRGKQNEPLLKALITTVGFLNKVELQQHPGKAGGETCLNNGASGQGTATQCQAASSDGSGTCTYEVHKFQGKSIQVKVECSQVKGKTGSSCYKKLTHTPIGTSGSGEGFRLGDVEYCKNCGSTGPKGSIKYYPNGSNGDSNLASVTNRWAPLVAVWAYFYDQDTQYKDPLLVVLMFRVSRTEAKECYKLKTANGSKLEWEKDTDACKKDGPELAAHLDEIRYCLKKVVKIELQHNGTSGKTSYALMGRDAKPGSAAGFTQINSGQVTVCEVVPCHKLNDSGYKCFRHDLKTALRGHHHEVAGLAFTLPGKNGSGSGSVIEIPLDPNGGKGDQVKCANGPGLANGQSGSKITYNQCMGDVCVYFYAHKGMGEGDNQTDTVPLMVKFNGHFYKPCDRDNYFTRWVCVSELASVSCKPGCKCCCCPTNADCGSDCTAQCSTDACKDDCECCSQLVKALNEVNLALNRIDLDKSNLVKTGSGSNGKGYGLPEKNECQGATIIRGCKLDTSVGNERVKVATQTPSGTDAKNAYVRVVHRTKNGFQIGEITYDGKDIKEGITPNGAGGGSGDTTIPIANGGHKNHKDLVSSNSWNTVVSYYSKTDSKHQLPQLIVILKTDAPLNGGEQTVTGSADTAYGYYILATQSGVSNGYEYQYKWRLVNSQSGGSGVQLDDATDFRLLNAGVILLERRDKSGGSYGDEQLKTAIASAIQNKSLNESPGNSKDVNRLQDKNIKVTDETGDYTCVSKYGFKVMAHDLKELVELSGFKSPPCEVRLITGLRFLIPSMYRENSYNEIKLCSNGSGTSCSMEDRHYYRNRENKICVYFYGSDPRPLLVSYNSWAYAPKTINGYFTDWYKADGLTTCGCAQKPPAESCDKCPLVTALVRVSNFLNPVKLQIVPGNTKRYTIHWFNTRPIRIEVEEKKADGSFCYNRYTHEHYGIGCGGTGFRLGDIYYKQECIKENGTKATLNGKCISASDVDDTKTYKPSPEVVVFYYRRDDNHEHPLLVALKGPVWCSFHGPYFELQKKVDPGQPKLYTRGINGLDLGDTSPDGELARTLDAILYRISKQLQVILAQRPVALPYSPDDVKNYSHHAGVDEQLKKRREQKDHELNRVAKKAFDEAQEAKAAGRTTGISTDPEAIRSSLTHHVLRETSYKGQLFEASGSTPASPPGTTLKITVREIDCHKSYSEAGYRCFQHLLTTATGIEQVGGLKLAVFRGQGGQGSGPEITLCTGNGTAGKNGSNCQNGKNGKKIDVTYTTCKGDIYVFFYGEDPRPLLLCYNSDAYRPTSMETYCTQWVRVNENGSVGKGVNCLCPQEPGGAAQLLEALYDVSQFMNPVRLCLTEEAYKKLDPEHGQDSQPEAQPGPVATSGQSEKAKHHSYIIHKESQPPVCVRVTGIDLRCYKQYVHQPEKHGFRLGQVTYASAEDGGAAKPAQNGTCTASQTPGPAGPAGTPGGTCQAPGSAPGTPSTTSSTGFCFAYPPEKQLWSVCVYYYMYDIGHNWPLVVELGFKGQSSEFFRLCCNGDNGAKPANGECKAPSGLKWVRMAGEGGNGSTQNGQGDCGTCPQGADNANNGGETPEAKAETCKKDAEFVEEATRLYRLAHGWDREVGAVFKAHESDLNDLIERRALEIRTQLGIEYGEKTKERLILETASNCWEDSIMAYVVGGGVLGVAGGGGWKIAVAVLGLVVKL